MDEIVADIKKVFGTFSAVSIFWICFLFCHPVDVRMINSNVREQHSPYDSPRNNRVRDSTLLSLSDGLWSHTVAEERRSERFSRFHQQDPRTRLRARHSQTPQGPVR